MCIWACNCPNNICWKDYTFPNEFSWHMCQKSMTINTKINFWTLNCVPFIYISTLMSIPHCPDNCIFIVSFEMRSKSLPTCLYQNCFGYFSCVHFHINFQVYFSIYAKKASQNFDRNCKESQLVESFHLNNTESSNLQTWNTLLFT